MIAPAAATTGGRPVGAHGRTVVFSSADGGLAPGRPSPGARSAYVRTTR